MALAHDLQYIFLEFLGSDILCNELLLRSVIFFYHTIVDMDLFLGFNRYIIVFGFMGC